MNAKIIATEQTEDGTSYRIQFENNLKLWFDTWLEDGELAGDWNQYIFYLDDPKDLEIKDFQNNTENIEIAFDLCSEHHDNN